MTQEIPECLSIEGDIHLIPPNEWLNDTVDDICPTCGTPMPAKDDWGRAMREAKLQHQLWHYIVASRVLPAERIFESGNISGNGDVPDVGKSSPISSGDGRETDEKTSG